MKSVVFAIALFSLLMPSMLQAQCLSGDCQNGKGIHIFKHNNEFAIYVGQFANNKANGYGNCYYSNGDKYSGEWKDHFYNGKGYLRHASGLIEAGEWADSELITSDPSVLPTNTTGRPKVWAVMVGIAAYENPLLRLNFTDDDAYRMFAFLQSPEGGALPDNQVRVLIDENATKANIIKMIDEVYSQAAFDDIIMFYFSGHGLEQSFLPVEFNQHNIASALSHEEVRVMLDANLAKHKICIVDACHSGGLQSDDPMNPAMLAMKGSINAEAVVAKYYEAFTGLESGTAFILSSKAEEPSIEHKGLRRGIFSHFLIRALKGEGDFNGDKIITLHEVFTFLQTNVSTYTSNFQTPVLLGNASKQMPMAVIR